MHRGGRPLRHRWHRGQNGDIHCLEGKCVSDRVGRRECVRAGATVAGSRQVRSRRGDVLKRVVTGGWQPLHYKRTTVAEVAVARSEG